MATLVLSTAGQIIGGPIGGAIGATIGQQIDARIFAPKARHGPRLGDLAVQSSSYGSQIPKLFGTIRVAGTVIWSTDLQEQKDKSGGGKGRPKTVTYSYSASFAVALSGAGVKEVRRIWADGKLLRGEAGDFKSEIGAFRMHGGDEDQAPDPLIAASEGADGTPAYRGLAYAVFEDLQLADFGNRIPSLSFEVVAEKAASLAVIAEALSGGAVTADSGAVPLIGYAATGDSARSAIEALAEVLPVAVTDTGERLRLTGGGSPGLLEGGGDAWGPDGAGGRMEVERGAASAAAAEVSIAFYDPARDYQAGLQRAAAAGEAGLRTERRTLPAVVTSDGAKGLAEQRLAQGWAERRQAKAHYGWAQAGVRPGAAVRVPGQSGRWRVSRWSLEKMVVTLGLSGSPAGMPVPAAAAPGRPVLEPDLLHGPTTLALLDLPLPGAGDGVPRLHAAASGKNAGWRSAALLVSFDEGASWQGAGATAGAATMGTLVAPAAAGPSAILDLRTELLVELLGEGMWLESRDDAALAGGANLAAVGSELVQFGVAEQVGLKLFRLSRLLRGRRGTEYAGAHPAGERFVLIEAESLAPVEVPAAAMGGEARLLGAGLGDGADGVEARVAVTGEALRPPSPVHLRAARDADGGLRLSWVRRSRSGWTWPSGADTPLGEEKEAYRVTVTGGFGARAAETTEPFFVYTAALQAADGAAGAVEIEVVQLGTHGPSRPVSLLAGLGED
jgi:hypothetical protein